MTLFTGPIKYKAIDAAAAATITIAQPKVGKRVALLGMILTDGGASAAVQFKNVSDAGMGDAITGSMVVEDTAGSLIAPPTGIPYAVTEEDSGLAVTATQVAGVVIYQEIN